MNTNLKLYKVLLLPGHDAKEDQNYRGYLGDYGTAFTYTRGEAIKKARLFGGIIEPIVKSMDAVITGAIRYLETPHVKYGLIVNINGATVHTKERFSLAELNKKFDLSRIEVNRLIKQMRFPDEQIVTAEQLSH
jgi:hypothetical protein